MEEYNRLILFIYSQPGKKIAADRRRPGFA